MDWLGFAMGAIWLTIGVVFIVRRDDLAEKNRRGTVLRMGRQGFATLGGLFVLLGLAQLVPAVASAIAS